MIVGSLCDTITHHLISKTEFLEVFFFSFQITQYLKGVATILTQAPEPSPLLCWHDLLPYALDLFLSSCDHR